MRCQLCNDKRSTKLYKNFHLCGECLKTLCLFCSSQLKGIDLILKENCKGHGVSFNIKHNRFLEDKQFVTESLMTAEEG